MNDLFQNKREKKKNDQFDCSEDAILHATIKPIHLSNAHNNKNLAYGVNPLCTSSSFSHLGLYILIDHIALVCVFSPKKQFILISSAAIWSKVLLKRIVIMS